MKKHTMEQSSKDSSLLTSPPPSSPSSSSPTSLSPDDSSQKYEAFDADKVEDGFFSTPTFQALTIGVPFCVFKLLFGQLALRVGIMQVSASLSAFGWLVIAWALADLLMNSARILFHLTGRTAPLEYCTLAQAGRLFKKPRLFLALDTLISFSIICFVLWSGWIVLLSREESYLWYAATTMNLISISVVNIWIELRRGM